MEMNHDNAEKSRPGLYPVALILAAVLAGMGGCRPADKTPERSDPGESRPNFLTESELDAGWRLLFNGRNLEGWRGLGRVDPPEGMWTVDNGCLHKLPSGDVPLQEDGQPTAGGDLITEEVFLDFELFLEWKISPGGNSGVKYNVSEKMSIAVPPETAALGFEYQILDDDLHPDAGNGPNRTTAALYDMIAPTGKILRPVGEFNRSRILFRGDHGEHWLNGVKVVEFDLNTPRMEKSLAASKYRLFDGFADKRPGHIVLQDHTDEVWFRNIKVRSLEPRRP